jgi:hypothetical protein
VVSSPFIWLVFRGLWKVACGYVSVGYCDGLLTTDSNSSQILILKILRTINMPVICRNNAAMIR